VKFAKKLKKVPGPVGVPVRLLGNTIGVLDNTVDFFKKIGGMPGQKGPIRGITPALGVLKLKQR
jgi:hypothetical protein